MTITAVLFDMDLTIIHIDEGTFDKDYFILLQERCFPDLELQTVGQVIINVTKKIMTTKTPSSELILETYFREMAPGLKKTSEELAIIFKQFYDKHFDDLRKHIKPLAGAREAIQTCFDKGYDVIIATAPVFPLLAIKKRLQWGGVLDFDYKLITHAENMHFSKPKAEYYLEILEKINRKADECMMVGNDFIADIMAPVKIGMQTFYTPASSKLMGDLSTSELKMSSKVRPTYQGAIKDFTQLVKNNFKAPI